MICYLTKLMQALLIPYKDYRLKYIKDMIHFKFYPRIRSDSCFVGHNLSPLFERFFHHLKFQEISLIPCFNTGSIA